MNDLESIRKKLVDMGLTARHVFAATTVYNSINKMKTVPFVQYNLDRIKDNYPITVWDGPDTPVKAWPNPNAQAELESIMLGNLVHILKTNTDTFRVIFFNNISDITTVVKIWVNKDNEVLFGSVKIWSGITAWEVVSRWNPKTRLLNSKANLSLSRHARNFGIKHIKLVSAQVRIPYLNHNNDLDHAPMSHIELISKLQS